MNLKEARRLKSKAIAIVKEYKTDDALQWFMNSHSDNFVKLDVKSPTGEKNEQKINKGICFESDGNQYELYYMNGKSLWTPDGSDGGGYGDFCLFFNGELVLITTYEEVGEWRSRNIRWRDIDIKILKLDDWVERIPEIKEKEEKLINNKKRKLEIESEKKALEGNFHLVKYE